MRRAEARKNEGGPHPQGAATVHKRRKASDFARFTGAETSSDRTSSDRRASRQGRIKPTQDARCLGFVT
jgi:hypothetical protein